MIFSNVHRPKTVLAIGECMAELATIGADNLYRMGFAGDTFNTAWYLAQISDDIKVQYLTAIGDDEISDEMRAFFRAGKISDRYVQTIPNKTVGLYQIRLKDGERSFTYWRGQAAARHLADDHKALQAALLGSDLIYFSGITLAILPPASRKRLMDALERARTAGKVIVFDPNLRPKLWETPDEMTATTMQAAALCDILLPSFDDEATWFYDENPSATCERYARVGVSRIIVKNSAKPVVFQWDGNDGEVDVHPLQNVIDTTAAGDSFNAGLLAGLLKGKSVEVSVQNGCALAGKVVQHQGALVPGLC